MLVCVVLQNNQIAKVVSVPDDVALNPREIYREQFRRGCVERLENQQREAWKVLHAGAQVDESDLPMVSAYILPVVSA